MAHDTWLGSKDLLANDPELRLGVLPTGLRWAFQHNAYPPNRLVAHLIVNTGSINEEDHQQGIAHVLEHAVFLGTEEYPHPEALRSALTELGMAYNADSNAYTDYRETVYTLTGPIGMGSVADAASVKPAASLSHAPSVKGPPTADSTTLPTILRLLAQLVFHARLDAGPLEAEKGSVLSEAAMRNSVDYRVEVASVGLVHGEEGNKLAHRLPIGHARLIKNFTCHDLRAYYEKWYKPEWMTVVVCGPVETESACAAIQAVFGGEVGPSPHRLPTTDPPRDALHPPFHAPPCLPAYPNPATLVTHAFNKSPGVPLRIVQHPLLYACGLSITLKKPLASMQVRSKDDFVEAVTDIVCGTIFEGRVLALRAGRAAGCKAGEQEGEGGVEGGGQCKPLARPLFNGILWDDSPSGGEGCAYQELLVGSDMRLEEEADDAFDGGPGDESGLWDGSSSVAPPWARYGWQAHGGRGHVWQRATAVAVREAIRFARHGPSPNEFTLACQTFLRECRDRVATAASVDTDDIVGEIEEGIRTGSAMPSRVQELEWVATVIARDVSLQYAKERARATFGVIERAALAAVARLEMWSAGAGCGEGEEGVCKGVFDELEGALTVFLCASGPVDSVTGSVPGEPREGQGTEDEAGLLDPDRDPQPGLLDRLCGTGRRAKLRALIAGETGAGMDEKDEEEEEEDEDMQGALAGVDGGRDDGHASEAVSPRKRPKEEEALGPPGTPARSTALSRHSSLGTSVPVAHMYPSSILSREVLAALAHGTCGVTPPVDVAVPSFVVSEGVRSEREREAQHAHACAGRAYGYLPVGAWPSRMRGEEGVQGVALEQGGWGGGERLVDSTTGITTAVLSNGLVLTYVRTSLEPSIVEMTLVARGGEASEGRLGWVPGVGRHMDGDHPQPGDGPYWGPIAYGPASSEPAPSLPLPWICPGATGLGLGTIAASGAADCTAEALLRLASLWGVQCSASVGRESIRMGVGVVTTPHVSAPREASPLARGLQFMHAYVASPRWDEAAFRRQKDEYVSGADGDGRSLESLTAIAVGRSMRGGHDPDCLEHGWEVQSKHARESITLAQAQHAIRTHWALPGNMQLVVVGDFEPAKLEEAVLAWLGPLLPSSSSSLPSVLLPAQHSPAAGTIQPLHHAGHDRGVAVQGSAGYSAYRLPYVTEKGRLSLEAEGWTVGQDGGGVVAVPHRADPSHACLPSALPPSTWVHPVPLPFLLRGRVVRLPCAAADRTPRCTIIATVPSVGKMQACMGVEADNGWDTGAFLRASSSPWPALRLHPLYLHRAHFLLHQVLNNRLYRALRDKEGLCYAVSYDMDACANEYSAGGWEVLSATPMPNPEAPPRALAHALSVVNAFYTGEAPMTEGEVVEVLKPVLEHIHSDMGRNAYWEHAALGLHCVQGGCKVLGHVHEMARMYGAFDREELGHALRTLYGALPQPMPIHVAVGVSGSLSFLPPRPAAGKRHRGAVKGTPPNQEPGTGMVGSIGTGTGGGEGEERIVEGLRDDGMLPLPDSLELRQEWSAFLERMVRDLNP